MQRRDGIAIWRQIAATLREEIADGRHAVGERMPGEATLAERFGVNRHTVRQAIAHLTEDGLLRAEQGRGTFVSVPRIEYRLGVRTRLTENLRRSSVVASRTLLSAESCPASPQLAARLAVAPGTLLICLSVRAHADGRPFSLAEHYFPAERFSNMEAAFRDTGSVTAALATHGVADYRRRTTEITARAARPDEAALLAIRRGAPLLVTDSVNVDTQGQPIEVGTARLVATLVSLSVDHVESEG